MKLGLYCLRACWDVCYLGAFVVLDVCVVVGVVLFVCVVFVSIVRVYCFRCYCTLCL